jgi:hypothetical protein
VDEAITFTPIPFHPFRWFTIMLGWGMCASLSGWSHQCSLTAGGIKILYDLLLLWNFQAMRADHERPRA